KEPVEAVKRRLAVDCLVDVQGVRDRLIVSRVQAERPAVLGQVPDDPFEFLLHHGRHLGARLQETQWVLAGPKGAAVRLGLNRSTLAFRMKKLVIVRPWQAGWHLGRRRGACAWAD